MQVDELSRHDGEFLLLLARKSIKQYLHHGIRMRLEELGDLSAVLLEPRACFVTYHRGGNLRGCIGSIMPLRPLYEDVIGRAVDAAVHDPRFPAMRREELEDVHIEISVLSPIQNIAGYEDFIAGEHGIILSKYGQSAVFLPHVATEQGWNEEQTLTHLAMKAGLPPDAWREGASFQIFTAQIFAEE